MRIKKLHINRFRRENILNVQSHLHQKTRFQRNKIIVNQYTKIYQQTP